MTRDEVAEVAALARLHLTDQELTALTADLTRILAGAKNLEWVEKRTFGRLEGVQSDLGQLRPDEVRPSLDHNDALAAAPEVEDGLVRVPKMLGEAP